MPEHLSDFRDHELVVFVGHGRDATEEAAVVKGLQGRLQDELRHVTKSGDRLASVKVWEWNHDAGGRSGGQDELITPALRRADFAVFVFTKSVGEVTWEELGQCRSSEPDRPHLAVVFQHPDCVHLDLKKKGEGAAWDDLLERRDELTAGWTGPDSRAVRPLDDFKDHSELEEVVLAHFRRVINDIVERANREPEPAEPPRPAGGAPVVAAYRRRLRAAHSRLAPFFGGRHTLDDVFVELDLDRHLKGKRGDDAAKLAEGGHEDRALTLAKLMSRPSVPGADHAGRWVVLGEPGAGKSTLARHLVWRMAGNECGPVPVFISLAQLAAEQRTRSVFEMAEEQLRSALGDREAAGLDEALRQAAHDGQAWIFLDGFDEVPGERRNRIAEAIMGLVGAFPAAPICVLSRPIGFRDLGPSFGRAHVQKLAEPKQLELLEKWAGEAKGRELWERLATRPVLCQATSTPLMLALVAKLGMESGDLPATRLDLYDRATTLLLEHGFAFDEEVKKVAAVEDARVILEQLSLRLQEQAKEVWPRRELSDYLRDLSTSDATIKTCLEPWSDRTAFLQDIADNSGIIGPHDGAHAPWRYVHRQFREFLAATAMSQKGADHVLETAAGLDEDSLGHWGECIGMACGLLDDPLSALDRVRESSAELALRMLLDSDGIEPRSAMAFLLKLEDWDGDDLRRLVTGWGVQSGYGREQAAEVIWEHVKPGDVERLSYLHYVLEWLTGSVDRARFFEACERPLEDVTIEWRPIPSGGFEMGGDGYDDEKPKHRVDLAAFELAAHPVTNEQYEVFDSGHEHQQWEGVDDDELARHPVVNVSWWEAYLFSRWLGGYLPTEAQWECACRAGSTTEYWSGDEEGHLKKVGWFGENSGGRSHAVGELEANRWGLHDVHGNVEEWCRDWFATDAYSKAPSPDDGLREIAGASYRVIRGGSWFNPAGLCRSAVRLRWHPGRRDDDLGFRPARASRLAP